VIARARAGVHARSRARHGLQVSLAREEFEKMVRKEVKAADRGARELDRRWRQKKQQQRNAEEKYQGGNSFKYPPRPMHK
jgi:hypothetical protein